MLNSARILLNNHFEQRVIYDIRSDLYAKLQRLPLRWFDGRRTGDIMTRVVEDVTAMERVLISTIYQARREVCLTTPYFVPDEPLLAAIISAVQRGVEVTLILPAKVDSKFVRWASQAFLDDLVRAGVRVLMFQGGLLHTKSVTVDGEISLFGSLNLDPRSLHLNFEITLAVYDDDFTTELTRLQSAYARESQQVTVADGLQRSRPERLLQNAARLLGPLL